MAQNKNGFSLIETLVAIMIASISVVALIQVVSRSSKISASIIRQFDSSLFMGLMANDINNTHQSNTLSAYDLFTTRYDIDHPTIRDSFQQKSYKVMFSSKEIIEPLSTNTINSAASTTSTQPTSVQKITIYNDENKKSFYRLTSGY